MRIAPLLLCVGAAFVAVALAPAAERASWRERYTLGPGDVLNFRLYGQPDSDRAEVFVRLDGTIGYLQATSVKADGLTLDELRAAMEQELARYYSRPRVIVTPVQLKSKRYFMVGKVVDRGSYPMEFPITLVEAVARCRGIETGLFEQNTVELADLPRSFIMRGGRRLPVDFEKLFLHGDFTQNIELEPNDYVFFASANTNEVYVLGEVVNPGVLGFTPRLTVVGALTTRGGFTRKAFRSHAVVVRGSLEKPECLVVDIEAILRGQQPDVALQPKDIVYVAERPWQAAIEIADFAINAFLQTATATWTGRNLPPGLPEGALPQLQPPPTR